MTVVVAIAHEGHVYIAAGVRSPFNIVRTEEAA